MAKPCSNCIRNSKQILEYKGYKLCNIFYTNEEGNLIIISLKTLNRSIGNYQLIIFRIQN